MALPDDLRIMNEACALIGQEPLESMQDVTAGGQAADLIYSAEIAFMIGVYVFSWSKSWFQLSRDDVTQPFSGWLYVFQLPAERIGPPLRLTDAPTDPDRGFTRYMLSGEKVHADADPLYAECKIVPEPRLWSGTFRKAAVTSLAGDLALAMAHDKDLRVTLKSDAYGPESMNFRGGLIGAAIREDAFATPPKRIAKGGDPFTSAWQS